MNIRTIRVVTLSGPEHALRDAWANIELRKFLPPEESGQTQFTTVTVSDKHKPRWPTDFGSDCGIVILGRPAVFGPLAEAFLEQCEPKLCYSFKSDSRMPDEHDYRTIVFRKGTPEEEELPTDLFLEQMQKSPPPRTLVDRAFVYSGWRRDQPVLLLAGTSTVGSWGAVRYLTEDPGMNDVRWQQDIQGVIEATVTRNPDEAFDSVAASAVPGHMLAPAHIWMDGNDLPPTTGWKSVCTDFAKRREKAAFDLEIMVNGRVIFAKSPDHLRALVLLAWMNSCDRAQFKGDVFVRCTTASINRWIETFLGSASVFSEIRVRIDQTLKAAAKSIRDEGGIAFIDPTKAPDGCEKSYCLAFRGLPRFLPGFQC